MSWTKRHLHIDLSHAFNQAKDASQQCILAETLWPLKNKPAGTVVSAESLSHRSDPHKRVEKREATNAGGCAGRVNLNTGWVSVRFRRAAMATNIAGVHLHLTLGCLTEVTVMTSHPWKTGNTLWWELSMSLQDAGTSWTDGSYICDSAAVRLKPRQTTRPNFNVETVIVTWDWWSKLLAGAKNIQNL